ncbi:hypothetical protein [Sulfuriferula nivalis]|uniref:hypothetical protein n=1 Tax=Sulfuriferula nivalis TaxID=2675298 RepID=UPI00138A001F|nr:hypothetical protein [Sulfuriferula nivalis]
MKMLKWLLVPVIAFAAFISYGFILDYLSQLIPVPDKTNMPFLLMALILPQFLASASTAVFCAYLLTALYNRKAIWVSFIVALPVLVVSLPELSNIGNLKSSTLVLLYEMVAYLSLMLGCSLILSKQTKVLNRHSSEMPNCAI